MSDKNGQEQDGPTIQITKFRHVKSKNHVVIEWDVFGERTDSLTLSTESELPPQILEQIAKVADDIRALCEIPKDNMHEVQFRQVVLKWSGEVFQVKGCVLRDMIGSTELLTLNAPMKRSEVADEAMGSQLLQKAMIARLEVLIDLVEVFLRQYRPAQGDLFDIAGEAVESVEA